MKDEKAAAVESRVVMTSHQQMNEAMKTSESHPLISPWTALIE